MTPEWHRTRPTAPPSFPPPLHHSRRPSIIPAAAPSFPPAPPLSFPQVVSGNPVFPLFLSLDSR